MNANKKIPVVILNGSWKAGIIDDDDHGLSKMEIDILKARLAKESGRFGDRYCDLTVIGDENKLTILQMH